MRLVLSVLIIFASFPAFAQEEETAFRSTGYPLPRFVSLRSDQVYVRSGPGQKYPVQWVFKKSALPVEIILEYDVWRKIRDVEGQVGWIHKSLLSGRRSAFVKGKQLAPIYKKMSKNSQVMAKLEPKVLVSVAECTSEWCFVNASGYKGWIDKTHLWGVYEHEKFD